MTSKKLSTHKSIRWRPPASWILKNGSLLFDRSLPNLVETLGVQFRTYLFHWKCINSCQNSRWRTPSSWISENGCHFFTIWLTKARFLVGIVRNWYRIHTWSRKGCKVTNMKHDGRRHLDLRTTVYISLPFWPIIAKFSGNVVTTIRNTSVT